MSSRLVVNSRDCEREPDGKFASGNSCAVTVSSKADVGPAAHIAPTVVSGLLVAAVGATKFGALGAAVGAIAGGVFGAIYSYFDDDLPEKTMQAQKAVGMSGKQVDETARAMGATGKDKAHAFVTTRDAFGLFAENGDIALITRGNPLSEDRGTARHLHYNASPSTPKPEAVPSTAIKTARAAGAKTVTVSSEDPWVTDALERAGFEKISVSSTLMYAMGSSAYQKAVPTKTRRYADLMEFVQSRNCGNGPGGFQPGNTCASGKASDAAVGAAKGAIKGAAIGAGLTWTPVGAAQGAAVGAATGAIGGIVKNIRRPARVMKTIERIGTTEEKVASLVKRLGGTPKSSADVDRKTLTLRVVNKNGEKIFDVRMNDKKIVITPSRKSGALSAREIAEVKRVASENQGKSVEVIVKSKSPSYLSSLVKGGFKVTADVGGTLVASAVIPIAATVGVAAGDAAVTAAAANVLKKRL